jgi:hypothetical protein
VFRTQRNRPVDSLLLQARRELAAATAAIDELLPASPSLQGYSVYEIDESLTAPLVRWLSKKSG